MGCGLKQSEKLPSLVAIIPDYKWNNIGGSCRSFVVAQLALLWVLRTYPSKYHKDIVGFVRLLPH